MRVAVTGGSGVVGSAVVRHLVSLGNEVWALARSSGASAHLDALGARVVHGDVLDAEAVMRLVKGSRRVFHIAGVNEMCSRDPQRMWAVNVDGSRVVLDACERAGVERLVNTSSAVTIGEPAGTVGREDTRHRGSFLSEYERSKTVAERLLFNAARDVEVVSVNPSSVQGPGRSTGTGALLLAAARGRIPFLVDTTVSIVDIDDCARGHVLAADNADPGERYILSGSSVGIRELVREVNRQLGRKGIPWFVTPSALTAVAPLVAAAFGALGKQAPLCSESARVLLHGHVYDGSRATLRLGLEYRPLGETLARTLEWFRAQGLMADVQGFGSGSC